jgi:hypothetical protein
MNREGVAYVTDEAVVYQEGHLDAEKKATNHRILCGY